MAEFTTVGLEEVEKAFLRIESPSKKFRDEVGVFMAQGIGVGFSDEMGKVNKQIEDNIPQEFDIGAKVNVDKDFTYDWDGDGNPKKPKPKGGGAAGSFTVIQNIYANGRWDTARNVAQRVWYIAYEVVSIFKNMALCGLPVKKVWATVRAFLGKYTDELPDTDELDGNSTTGSVEGYRQQEK